MTPPPKKSSSQKIPAKGPAKGSAKASTGKRGGKAPVSRKKRPRKKKKDGRFSSLLLAFVAGMLLTSAIIWFLRDQVSLRDTHAALDALPQATTTVVKQEGGRAERQKKQTPPPAVQKTPGASAKQKKNRDAPGPDSAAADNSAVASALQELQSLPFEEALDAHLEESIRQIDYAIMQTTWIRQLPVAALRQVSVEERRQGKEHYRHQVIDVLPGKDASAFISSLRDSIAIWAAGASLAEREENVYVVRVNNVPTHTLRLFPGQARFRAGETSARPGQEKNDSQGSLAQPRMRQAGEEARLVIVMDDLGANPAATGTLLALGYPVTFAFWPHGAHTRDGALAAHAKGREILVHQPMEPVGYPKVKPGPNVLLSGMDEASIRNAVSASLAAVPYATGLNNHMGSRFTQNPDRVRVVIRVLQERGMFALDSVTHSRSVFAQESKRLGLACYRRNVFLDVTRNKGYILDQLRRAERIALLTGQAIAIGHPLPETLAALKEWERSRNKKIRIVRLCDLRQE